MNAPSEARREANRRNARKSTGPKTEAGKYRSSMNGLKHGIRAERPVIMNAESVDEWVEHRRAILDDLKPVGPIETALAERIVGYFWRIHRVARHEAAVASNSIRNVGHDVASVLKNHELARSKNEAIAAERIRGPLTEFADIYNIWGDSAIKNPNHAKQVDQIRAGFAELREQLVLPDQETAFLITRYEGHLERNLHRTMKELERRQNIRLERSGNIDEASLDPDDNFRFEPARSDFKRPIVVNQTDPSDLEDSANLDDDLQMFNNILAEALKSVNLPKEHPIVEETIAVQAPRQSSESNREHPQPRPSNENEPHESVVTSTSLPIDASIELLINNLSCDETAIPSESNVDAIERSLTIGSTKTSDLVLSDQACMSLSLKDELASLGRSSFHSETTIGERNERALTDRIRPQENAADDIEDDEDEESEDDDGRQVLEAAEIDERIIKRLSRNPVRTTTSHALIGDRSLSAYSPSSKI